MQREVKVNMLYFLFHFICWIGISYVTLNKDEEWRWLPTVLISAGYASAMTYMSVQQGRNRQLYLIAGKGSEIQEFLQDEGFKIIKKKGDTTFFKKPGLSLNPFRYTTIKESKFYTLLTASDKIIEKVPIHIERGRQPII